MKNKRRAILAFGFFFSILLLSGQVCAQEKSQEITVTGTVVVITFDKNGNVEQLALSEQVQVDEDDVMFVNYIIVNDKKSKELFRLIGKTVRITGKLVIDKNDNRKLTVKEYKVVNSNPS